MSQEGALFACGYLLFFPSLPLCHKNLVCTSRQPTTIRHFSGMEMGWMMHHAVILPGYGTSLHHGMLQLHDYPSEKVSRRGIVTEYFVGNILAKAFQFIKTSTSAMDTGINRTWSLDQLAWIEPYKALAAICCLPLQRIKKNSILPVIRSCSILSPLMGKQKEALFE